MKSLLLLLPLSAPLSARAFVTPSSHCPLHSSASSSPAGACGGAAVPVTRLAAKKKKQRSASSGAGFGKSPAASAGSAVREEPAEASEAPRALQSIEGAPLSAAAPTMATEDLGLDPNLSPEERSQAILRQKFGLKSYEEQQADVGDYRAVLDADKKKARRDKLRNIEELWPEDKGIVEVLPPGFIKGVDTFLKAGLGVSTVAFIAAGILITIEAGSKATGTALPPGWEAWIETVVEPNFTPGLGVLLGFSVSLGLFSVALGGSASSTYREDP
ncbi:hypothetical protein ACHAXT_007662 [Thalassiosira profunda]